MPVLHMETEKVRELAAQMGQFAQNSQDTINLMNAQVRGVYWFSNSQAEFISHYNELSQSMSQLLEELLQIRQRVLAEVDEWEDMVNQSQALMAALPSAGMTLWKAFGNTFDNFRAIFAPYELSDGMEYLDNTDAGKELIQQAKDAGLKFKVGDKVYGDPNGQEIEIKFGKMTYDNSSAEYYPDIKPGDNVNTPGILVKEKFFFRHTKGKDELGGIIAHEIQHAVDARTPDPNADAWASVEVTDKAELERLLADEVSRRVAGEDSAYKRQNAVQYDREYTNDGQVSIAEAKNILISKDYESIYEQQYSDPNYSIGKNYSVDVQFNESTGEVSVKLNPRPAVTEIQF